MKNLRRIIRRSFYVVKIQKETWQKISDFISENYNNLSVTIERQDEVDVMDGMDLAYEMIKEYQDSITRIIIFANTLDESLEITLNTRRTKFWCAMSIYGYCHDFETCRKLQILCDSLIIQTRASTNLIRISAIFCFYGILLHVLQIINITVMEKWLVILLLFISLFAFIAFDFFVYNPVLEDLLYGKKRIQFWVDEKSIDMYTKLKRRGRFAGAILVAASLVIMYFWTGT